MPKSILKTHMSRSVLFLFAFYMKGLFSVFKKNSFVRTCICIKVLDYNYFNCVAMGKLKLHKGYHIHKLLKRFLNFISVMKIMYKYNSICRDLVKKGISHPCFLGDVIDKQFKSDKKTKSFGFNATLIYWTYSTSMLKFQLFIDFHQNVSVCGGWQTIRFVLSTSLTSLLWVHSPQVLRNMPIIITLQRFLTHSPLWLSTSSLHDSHYIAESHDKPQRPVTII